MSIDRVKLGKFSQTSKRSFGRIRYTPASSIAIKLGICALVLALVLVIKAAKDSSALLVNASAPSTHTEEYDETLGKLKFVELPGIIEVFSQDGSYSLNLHGENIEAVNDGTVLCIEASFTQPVNALSDGKVRLIGTDQALMGCVIITADSGREIRFEGLSEINVEEGQSVASYDHVGSVEGGQKLSVSVYKDGRPLQTDKLIRIYSSAMR